MGSKSSQFGDDGIGKLIGGSGAAEVAGEGFALGKHGIIGRLDFFGDRLFVDVVEHHHAGHNHRQRVGDPFVGDVRGRAMDGFEDGRFITDVAAGDNAQAADQSGAQIAHEIAIEIFHQQDIEMHRILYEFHAAGVDDDFLVIDVGIFLFVNLPGAIQEKAVGQLHDVGFVEDGDFLAMPSRGVAKGIARDARAGGPAGDFEAGDDAGDDLIFDAAVEAFGVFANDHHVDIFIARLDARHAAHRPDGGVEIQLLAKLHVDGFEPFANGCGDRAFEGDFRLPNRGDGLVGQDVVVSLIQG